MFFSLQTPPNPPQTSETQNPPKNKNKAQADLDRKTAALEAAERAAVQATIGLQKSEKALATKSFQLEALLALLESRGLLEGLMGDAGVRAVAARRAEGAPPPQRAGAVVAKQARGLACPRLLCFAACLSGARTRRRPTASCHPPSHFSNPPPTLNPKT